MLYVIFSLSLPQTHDTARFASCFNWLRLLPRPHLQEWDIQGTLGSVQLSLESSFSVLLNFKFIKFRVFVFGSKVLSENPLWFSRPTSFIHNKLPFKYNVKILIISRMSFGWGSLNQRHISPNNYFGFSQRLWTRNISSESHKHLHHVQCKNNDNNINTNNSNDDHNNNNSKDKDSDMRVNGKPL